MTPEDIKPGIYFGLDENTYHAAPWVGSSSAKKLYACPPDFWHESAMNPLREPDNPSFAQTFGRALHHRILYGEEAFKRDYTTIEGTTGDAVSAEDLKTFLRDHGAAPAKLKADNEVMVRDMGINLLTYDTWQKIMVAAAHITKNPNLEQAFTGGFPEVSVFWYEEDVPCKCRFDYLKSRAIVDLKSFRSKERIQTLDKIILQDMFSYRYDVQCAWYLHGHSRVGELLEAGAIFTLPGATRPADEWLKKAFAQPAHWVFVFFRADGMPIAKSYQIPHGSPAHESGKAAMRVALDAYRDNLAKFGTGAWVVDDPPYVIDEEDMPKWL